jgi:hypothetical protein
MDRPVRPQRRKIAEIPLAGLDPFDLLDRSCGDRRLHRVHAQIAPELDPRRKESRDGEAAGESARIDGTL